MTAKHMPTSVVGALRDHRETVANGDWATRCIAATKSRDPA